MTDDKVVDLNLRRAQHRKKKGEESVDPVVRAAERLTLLYGELAMEVSTQDLYTAVALAEKAMHIMHVQSIGEEAARAYGREGLRRALRNYNMTAPTHYHGPTVFDKDDPDG